MIKLKYDGREEIVKPTIFPDLTSQVWKLEIPKETTTEIVWYFESEAEVFQLLQLARLLQSMKCEVPKLFIPFLPYARQDKEISNNATFALQIFMGILRDNLFSYTKVYTLDVHSNKATGIYNIRPVLFISDAIRNSKPDAIVLPDKGALERYADIVGNSIPIICLVKDRDQLTGKINSIKFSHPNDKVELQDCRKVLIVDDLCDRGGTFIEAASFLKKHNPDVKVNLYTTHSIYSGTPELLLNNNINHLYTTNSFTKVLSTDKITIYNVSKLYNESWVKK